MVSNSEYEDTIRTKGKHNAGIKTRDLYNYYISQLKPVDSILGGKTLGSYNISEKLYSEILKEINISIIRLIILDNFEFKLPSGLGKLSMVQRPLKYKLDENGELETKYLSLDYKATKDLWKSDPEAFKNKTKIFHTNEHTNGNRMAYKWSKKNNTVGGLDSYYFLACRQVKRAPSAFLKDPDLKLCFFEGYKRESTYVRVQEIINNKTKC